MARHVLRDGSNRVGFAELFYDLVFVFAITQVSHGLLAHYDAFGAAQTGFLFLAVWWVWIYTTWVLNRLDPEQTEVRLLLFALMLLGLFLSMALPDAFGARALVFALSYVTMQLGRTAFVWLNATDPVLRTTYTRIGLWFVASAVFWIAGALAGGAGQWILWLIALAIEYAGPAFGFAVPRMGRDVTTNWSVRGEHMAERCGLFVIICLGETLLVSGATFAEMDWTAPGVGAFLGAVLGTIGMWWVYFHIGHKRAAHQIEHSDDPGRLARLAFTYAHIPIVAGVVLAAVGSERGIAHPLDAGTWAESASVIGGLALFLAGNGWFKAISGGNFPLSHMIGLAISAALVLVGPWTNLMVLNLAAAATLALVAFWENRSLSAGQI